MRAAATRLTPKLSLLRVASTNVMAAQQQAECCPNDAAVQLNLAAAGLRY